MRRADRLFRLVQLMRGGRLWTAARLAGEMEVSERTIYRDVADLQASGVPIDGEAGIGYIMRDGFDLPPLMFTTQEIVALVAGARMVETWGGTDMAKGARDALCKIRAAVPDEAIVEQTRRTISAPTRQLTQRVRRHIDELNHAITERQKLHITYKSIGGATSERVVHPLTLWFWGTKWTLAAWCETREDFRFFRVDLMEQIQPTGDTYPKDPTKSMEAMLICAAEEGYVPWPDPLA
ncbi:MAG: YafY family protein [Pseudomonadota bacterium]